MLLDAPAVPNDRMDLAGKGAWRWQRDLAMMLLCSVASGVSQIWSFISYDLPTFAAVMISYPFCILMVHALLNVKHPDPNSSRVTGLSFRA